MRKTQLDPSDLGREQTRYTHGPFDYARLDVFAVARQAVLAAEPIVRRLPADRADLGAELRHALLAAYLGVAETASQTGPPREAGARAARAKAAQATAALELMEELGLVPTDEIEAVMHLIGRLCAMLTRLGQRTTLPR